MSKKSIGYIKNSIMVGQPIIQIISYEEKRVENLIKGLFQQLKRDQTACYWDINNGLVRENQIVKGTTDPVQALNYLIKENLDPLQENPFRFQGHFFLIEENLSEPLNRNCLFLEKLLQLQMK